MGLKVCRALNSARLKQLSSADSRPPHQELVKLLRFVQMILKRLILKNFLSYKDTGGDVEFGPNLNTIVGRNGSGKSNLFRAIEFVVSNAYSNVKKASKLSLVRTGHDLPSHVETSVEIVFSRVGDDRCAVVVVPSFSSDKSEMSVKRVLKGDKDQYYVNGKLATRPMVMNMLESAGFAVNNPYYIIKQNKVSELAIAPDSERLSLFYEVVGVSFFNKRREEASKLMCGAGLTVSEIKAHLGSINDALKDYEKDKDELMVFFELEADKKYLEMVCVDAEISEVEEKHESLRERREAAAVTASVMNAKMAELGASIFDKEQQVDELEAERVSLSDERLAITAAAKPKYEEFYKAKGRKEVLSEKVACAVTDECELRRRYESCVREVDCVGQEVSALRAELQGLAEREREKSAEVENVEMLMRAGERGGVTAAAAAAALRAAEIRSKKARLSVLEKEVGRLERVLGAQEQCVERTAALVEEVAGSVAVVRAQNAEWSVERERARQAECALVEARQDVAHEEAKLAEEVEAFAREQRDLAEKLRRVTGASVLRGVESVKGLLLLLADLPGYRGLLIDGIGTTDRIFNTAVEVSARNRLFHHLVDTDIQATELIKLFNARRLPGSVNVLPLNRITIPPDISLSRGASSLRFALISKITRRDEKVDAAVRHVFGRCVVASDFAKGSVEAAKLGLECVSLEGDRMATPGVFSGGFVDTRYSKLSLRARFLALEARISDANASMAALSEKRRLLDARLSESSCKVSDATARLEVERERLAKFTDELSRHRAALDSARAQVAETQKELASVSGNAASVQFAIGALSEQRRRLKSSSSSSEAPPAPPDLGHRMRLLAAELGELRIARKKKEAEIGSAEERREAGLRKQRDALDMKLLRVAPQDDDDAELRLVSERLDALGEWIRGSEQRLTGVSEAFEGVQERVNGLTDELIALRDEEAECGAQAAASMEQLTILSDVIYALQQRLDSLASRKESIGMVTSEAQARCSSSGGVSSTRHECQKRIEEINAQMERYRTLNKNAFIDYKEFIAKRDELNAQLESLQGEGAAVSDFLTLSEHAKAKVVNETFAKFEKNFADIFRKLIGNGNATLSLCRKVAETGCGGGGGGGGGSSEMSDSYTQIEESEFSGTFPPDCVGIGIRVRFSAGTQYISNIHELSGGQKTIVAIAIILALQQINPAPFYLFDEIDQALDIDFRNSVANLIEQISRDSQCVVITFKPELIHRAAKLLGVVCGADATSELKNVDSNMALNFVTKT